MLVNALLSSNLAESGLGEEFPREKYEETWSTAAFGPERNFSDQDTFMYRVGVSKGFCEALGQDVQLYLVVIIGCVGRWSGRGGVGGHGDARFFGGRP